VRFSCIGLGADIILKPASDRKVTLSPRDMPLVTDLPQEGSVILLRKE
jgi:hypothetical protein